MYRCVLHFRAHCVLILLVLFVSAYTNYAQNSQAGNSQQWYQYYGIQQQQAGYMQQQQPLMSLGNIEQVARAIYAAVSIHACRAKLSFKLLVSCYTSNFRLNVKVLL